MIESLTLFIYVIGIYCTIKTLGFIFRSYKYRIIDETLIHAIRHKITTKEWIGNYQILKWFPLTYVRWDWNLKSFDFVFYLPGNHDAAIEKWSKELARAPYDMDEILTDIYWARLEAEAGRFPTGMERMNAETGGVMAPRKPFQAINHSNADSTEKAANPSRLQVVRALLYYLFIGELPDFLVDVEKKKSNTRKKPTFTSAELGTYQVEKKRDGITKKFQKYHRTKADNQRSKFAAVRAITPPSYSNNSPKINLIKVSENVPDCDPILIEGDDLAAEVAHNELWN